MIRVSAKVLSSANQIKAMPADAPATPTIDQVKMARRIAEAGGALPTVARACGVPLSTAQLWLKRAQQGVGSKLEAAFSLAIQQGHSKAEIQALEVITGANRSILAPDPRDAQWWLTHNPSTRETWSDAAAERRAVQRTLTGVVAAIDAAGLSDDQRTRLLLTMQAQGIGVQVEGE